MEVCHLIDRPNAARIIRIISKALFISNNQHILSTHHFGSYCVSVFCFVLDFIIYYCSKCSDNEKKKEKKLFNFHMHRLDRCCFIYNEQILRSVVISFEAFRFALRKYYTYQSLEVAAHLMNEF